MDNMGSTQRPPAAEPLDVANAVHDGFAGIVLSPRASTVPAVEMSRAIIERNAVADLRGTSGGRTNIIGGRTNIIANVGPVGVGSEGPFTQDQAAQWIDAGVNTFRFGASDLEAGDLRAGVDRIRPAPGRNTRKDR